MTGALTQLSEYIVEYWNQNGRRSLEVYVTDCIVFRRYRIHVIRTPLNTIFSMQDIELEHVETLDLDQLALFSSNGSKSKLSFFKSVDKLLNWFNPGFPLIPTPESMSTMFGTESLIFKKSLDLLNQANKNEYKTQYDEWNKYLSIVYGTNEVSFDIFLRHTYLATMAKAIVFLYILKKQNITEDEKIAVLEGGAFKHFGITNFLVEDFFSWVSKSITRRTKNRPLGLIILDMMLENLRHFNLDQLNQDVLKDIYQNVAEPKDRHDLGEFYTPDWLAEHMVEELITSPNQKILDPSCGSGSFLAAAIRKILSMPLPPHCDVADHIVNHVIGIDIHPIAVLFSKANYLLALKAFSKDKPINIPVYLADSIDFPRPTVSLRYASEDDDGVYVHTVQYYEKSKHTSTKTPLRPRSTKTSQVLTIPKQIIESPDSDTIIDEIQKYAKELVLSDSPSDVLEEFAAVIKKYNVNSARTTILTHTVQTLSTLIKQKQDSIHAFILKNIYKPAIMDKFDIIIGNPPWIVYNSLGTIRQQTLKKYLRSYSLLPKQQTLFTSTEIATLFYVRCADLFLKENGRIGFVMPRSIFNGDQHNFFRLCNYSSIVPVIYDKIYDMGFIVNKVRPLFSIPSCVIFGTRVTDFSQAHHDYEIPTLLFSAKLPRKNMSLSAINKLSDTKFHFKTTPSTLYVAKINSRSAFVSSYIYKELQQLKNELSTYKGKFFQGASLVPRFMWFVEDPHVTGRISAGTKNTPFKQSSINSRTYAKPPWNNKTICGMVEIKYLHNTIVGQDILPYVYKNYLTTVLPLQSTSNSTNYSTLNSKMIGKYGDKYMKSWMIQCEKLWLANRGKSLVPIEQYINFHKKITNQNPNKKLILLYSGSGTYVNACLVDTSVLPYKFVADTTTYYYYPISFDEGLYLCAVLNSGYLLKLVHGIKSERHIHTKVFEFPISSYDSTNPLHQTLVSLARDIVELLTNKSLYVATRHSILDRVASQSAKIDLTVKKLFQR